ncbi:hypothetical protein ABBQ32_001426 [Trebouxia sp. C0010 RCD-2024]
MAINLQDSTASYGFQKQQQQAVHIRITREMKEALERARTDGEATSIQLPGAGAGLVIKIGNHSYETHPPSAQERFHVFTKSQAGCTEIAQIHQRAVVKRASLVNGHNQPAVSQAPKSQLLQQPHQIPHQSSQRPSSGPVQNGKKMSNSQQAEPIRKPHLQNGSMQPQAVQRPAGQQKCMAPPPQPRAPHAAAPPSRQPAAAKPVQMRPPPPASGSHPSCGPSAHPPSGKVQAPLAAQRGVQNASAGGSNQSAQTTLPHKEPAKGKPGHGKATAAAGVVIPADVLQKVCSIAEREEKPNQPVMLAALLLCKPPSSKVIEALMVEVEKRVRGFQRMQGNTLKGIYSRLSDFKPGNVRQLKPAFIDEANRVVNKPSDAGAKPAESSAALHTAHPDSAHSKKKGAERQILPDRGAGLSSSPTPEPQRQIMELPPAGPQQTAQGGEKSKKKRKRLTKAADMMAGTQSMDAEQPASGLGASLQAAWLTDQDTDVDDAAAARGHKSQKTASGARYTPHQDAAQPSTFRQATAQQPATMSWYQHRAGSLGAEGTGHVQDPPMSDAEQPQAAATQPAGPKITLKLKRRWSAGSEDYDDSWFAQHVDRQPVRKGPVSSLHEFQEMVQEYDIKHAIYFKLHQEIQDLSVKVEGLQQAIRKAGSEAEKVKYQEQFMLMWNRRLPHSKRWDRAFATLHTELEAMHAHLQAFYDQHT